MKKCINYLLGVKFLFNSTTVGESDGVAAFTLISSFSFDKPFTVQVTSGDTDPVSATSIIYKHTIDYRHTVKYIDSVVA